MGTALTLVEIFTMSVIRMEAVHNERYDLNCEAAWRSPWGTGTRVL